MQRKRIPLCNTLNGFILWEKILSLWRAQKERDQKECDTAFIEISFIISIKHPRRQFTMVFLGRFCSHHEHVFLSEAGRGYNKKPKVFYWSKKNTKKKWNSSFPILFRLCFYRHVRLLPDYKCSIVVRLGHKSNQPDCWNQILVLLLFVGKFPVQQLMRKNMMIRKKRRKKMMTVGLKTCCCFWKSSISFICWASRRT